MCGCTTSTELKSKSNPNEPRQKIIKTQIDLDKGLCVNTEIHLSCEELIVNNSKPNIFAVIFSENFVR